MKKNDKQETAKIPAWMGNHPFPPNKKKPFLITKDLVLSTVYGIGPNRVAPQIYVSTDKILMSHFIVAPGGHFDPPDIHVTDEPYYILKGTITLVNPELGEALEVKAGDAAWVPAGGWHVAYNFGEEEAIVIAVIAGKVWDETKLGSAIEFTGVPQFLKTK